ncbi:MAG: GatB/YqeY domain-containing protein [Gemmatimonadaceae bacterium]|nr:GatB/YqeY domain-containing protein [Gemmatimonadaceae bacterium]
MAAELFARLQGDLNNSRKVQDKATTLLLGTVLSEVKNKQIELRREPTDDDVVDVIRKAIKKRRESIDVYTKAGRADRAEQEKGEADALAKYLPAQVGEDELRAAVKAAIAGGANNIGAVMGKVLAQYKGKAEGGTINAIAREELGKQG